MAKTSQDIAQGNYISRSNLAAQIEADVRLLPLAGRRESFARLPAIFVLAVMDLAILAIALSLAFRVRLDILPYVTSKFSMAVPPTLLNWVWVVLFIGLSCLAYEGLYTKRLHFWQETKQIIKAATLALVVMLAAVSLGKLSGEVSRTVLVLSYLISIILLPMGRLIGKSVLVRVGIGVQPVLILGAGKTGEMIAGSLLRERYLGYRIAGFLDEDPTKFAQRVRVNGTSFPILGSFRDSRRVMDESGVRHLIVATPGMPSRELVGLVNRLQREAASVTVIPDLFDLPVMGIEADYSFDDHMLSFKIRNNLANPWNMLAKRAFDLVVGSMSLIAILPVLILITVAIKLDSQGPAIFSQRRIGRISKEFSCYKFRTMVTNAQQVLDDLLQSDPIIRKEWLENFKLKNDPRITRVGKFLRKTSLDELPQIFNVLKGEMSLVGPRPRPLYELDTPDLAMGLFDVGISVRPGMAGLWQVSGRSELDFKNRLMMDAWYARNWSLWLDISLLFKTIPILLFKKGAY